MMSKDDKRVWSSRWTGALSSSAILLQSQHFFLFSVFVNKSPWARESDKPRAKAEDEEKKRNEEDIEKSDYWTVKQVESHYDGQHEK